MERRKCDQSTGLVFHVTGINRCLLIFPYTIRISVQTKCYCTVIPLYCYRVDELYKFLQLWVPHLYGELCPEEVRAKGFEFVESDTELWDDDGAGTAHGSRHHSQDGEIAELTRESWEVS